MKTYNSRSISAFDKLGRLIQTFPSFLDAARWLGKKYNFSNVNARCDTFFMRYGYFWYIGVPEKTSLDIQDYIVTDVNLPGEEWRTAIFRGKPYFPYEVSNKGRIRSMVYTFEALLLIPMQSRWRLGKVISSRVANYGGYERVPLFHKDATRLYTLHRIIAETWLPKPNGYFFVRHKDGDLTNNCVDNLEWFRSRETQGGNHPPKIVQKCDAESWEVLETFPSISAASRAVGCVATSINRACRSGHFTVRGFRWRFASSSTPTKFHKSSTEIKPIHEDFAKQTQSKTKRITALLHKSSTEIKPIHEDFAKQTQFKTKLITAFDTVTGDAVKTFPSYNDAARWLGEKDTVHSWYWHGSKVFMSHGYFWQSDVPEKTRLDIQDYIITDADLPGEEWRRAIFHGSPHFPYEVSNKGRVRAMVYTFANWAQFDYRMRWRFGKVIEHRSIATIGGYERVMLRYRGSSRFYVIHRLVAETWIPNPNHCEIVRHKDGDLTNNCVDNLEWCTRVESYNKSHPERIVRQVRPAYPIKNVQKCAVDSWEPLETYPSISAAARAVGCGATSIRRACDGALLMRGFRWRLVE